MFLTCFSVHSDVIFTNVSYGVFSMSARITARFTMHRVMLMHNGQIYLETFSYLFQGYILNISEIVIPASA